jgi:hypothetical protein
MAARPKWLLLVHQLPARPTNVRVKTWRRLQDVGAVAVKSSVYALPNSQRAREDFEWIKEEIESMKGQASVFAADTVDSRSDVELRRSFHRNAETEYSRLELEAQKLLRSATAKTKRPPRSRVTRGLKAIRERFTDVARRDFFGVGGRDLLTTLDAIEKIVERGPSAKEDETAEPLRRKDFRRRRWVTRPRPGIDRMGSAWLIRRFIDPEARFGFAERPGSSRDSVPFDMFGVPFGHQGQQCTMEVLAERFAVDDPAVEAIARIVHQIDLKDQLYVTVEAPALERLVNGLALVCEKDRDLLESGMLLFEALYRSISKERRAPARGRKTVSSGSRTKR